MAENPLLPDDQLRALYAQTKRAATLEGKRPQRSARPQAGGSRAALIAACTLQLLPSDLLLCDPLDTTMQSLAPEAKPAAWPTFSGKQSPLLLAAAAIASGIRAAGSDALVFASVEAGAEQLEWAAALEWAQKARLPLVIACADHSGFAPTPLPSRPAGSQTLSWPSVRKQTNLLQFPVLTVDGEDAVAVYRCMQESILRARAGGGPAMLWATFPSSRKLRKSRPSDQEPLGRIREYLRSRKISLRAGS